MSGWSVLDAKFYSAPGEWCLPSKKYHITDTQNPEELLIFPTEIDVETEDVQMGSEEWSDQKSTKTPWTEFYSPTQSWTSVTNISDKKWLLPDSISRARILSENTFEHLKETRNVEEFNIFPEDSKVIPEDAQAGYKEWSQQGMVKSSWSEQSGMETGWYVVPTSETLWSESIQSFYFYWSTQEYTPLFYWILDDI